MEAGQLLHNNPVEIETTEFVDALVRAIRRRISSAYLNVNQKPWKGAEYGDSGGDMERFSDEWRALTYDSGIPGIKWREYYNWGGSPEDENWDQNEADKPNFSFEGVEIRWYKHFGRSMNVNVCWSADRWQHWFERAMQTIQAWEDEHHDYHHGREPVKYPNSEGRVSLVPTQDDLRCLELLEDIHTLEAQITCICCVCIDAENGEKPRFDRKDWRWCEALEWVTKLGIHALSAPGKFKLHDN